MSGDALSIAQAYVKARDERREADKAVEALKERELVLKQQLLDYFEANKVKSVGDGRFNYALVTSDEPTVTDWNELYAHIRRTGEFELLFRRLNNGSVKDHWDNGVLVPGVGKFPTVSLSITKAKGAK
jgi:hypothetical protein